MIDTEALRKKVIDLAIQGKLTQQLPEDGSAAELYAQIQGEKVKLIKEGKIKKEKSMPEIVDDEIPFEIPQNWKWVYLRDICKKIVDGDHNPPAGIKEKTEYVMLSAQNINNDELVNIENARYLTKDNYIEENKRTQLEDGDVLLTIVATLGRSCVYRGHINACFQRSVCVITTMIIPEYLKRVFDSGYIQKTMEDNATGAAQPGFYLNKVEKLYIPIPPLSEQKRIVGTLDSVLEQLNTIDFLQKQYESDREILKGKIIDAGVRGLLTEQLPGDGDAKKAYEQIQAEKKTLIDEGKLKKTRGFKAISEDEIPCVFPKEWKACYLDDVAFVTKLAGFEYTNYIADSIQDNGIPLFKGKNIQKGELVLEFESYIPVNVSDELPRSQVNKKCLLTPYVGTIGNIALFDGSFRAHLGSNVGKIEILNPSNECLMEEFLLLYLRSSVGYAELTKHKKATAQDSISIDAIRNVIVAIPPIEEQKRIVERIGASLRALELAN